MDFPQAIARADLRGRERGWGPRRVFTAAGHHVPLVQGCRRHTGRIGQREVKTEKKVAVAPDGHLQVVDLRPWPGR